MKTQRTQRGLPWPQYLKARELGVLEAVALPPIPREQSIAMAQAANKAKAEARRLAQNKRKPGRPRWSGLDQGGGRGK